jgi:NAD-dependent dihydropyrimidine dehydrogenase PreA subunit
VSGIAVITEACIDVCPVQCIYEFVPEQHALVSEDQAGSGVVANTHAPREDVVALFGERMLYVHREECTACTACYQPDVCPVGAIYPEEAVPDGNMRTKYNPDDPNRGHDHTFFIELNANVFAD